MSEVIFFKTKKELQGWFRKNHSRQEAQWMGFVKKATGRQQLKPNEAFELALCYGWSGVVIKRIDLWSYQVQFRPRKVGSVWSAGNIKKFKELKKMNLIQKSGQKAFDARKKTDAQAQANEFAPAQLKLFKKHKKAWAFFQTQTPSYRKYMVHWVMSAKQDITRDKRMSELIADSESGTKLKRILKASEKVKPCYEEGKTPVEEGKNLGLTTGHEFRAVGIETLEQLKRIGWERAIEKVCHQFPHRINLNFISAVIGAVEEQSSRSLDADLKQQARDILEQLRADSHGY